MRWLIYAVGLNRDNMESDARKLRLAYKRVRLVERTVSALGVSQALWVVVVDITSGKP